MESWQAALADIRSSDRTVQGRAFETLIEATERPVDWADEVWDDLLADLRDRDNRVRSIASQILCNLAKSDPDGRLVRDFPRLLEVTRDERFVTARHCLQALWKVGVAGPEHRRVYRDGMVVRFTECRSEKNWSLIRSDIAVSLRQVYEVTGDEGVRDSAYELIDGEVDDTYRAKYTKIWMR